MKICMMIEGQHRGESFESSHGIDPEMIQAYVNEFLEAYKENPKSARLNMFYCNCGCCDESSTE